MSPEGNPTKRVCPPTYFRGQILTAIRKPRDYQIPVLEYALSTEYPALFLDPRLGKTFICVRSINLRHLDRILISTPYETFNSWINELDEENELENGLILLEGTRPQRLALLRQVGRWYMINHDGYRVIPEITEMAWNCLILDESASIKDPTTQRSKFYTKNFRSVQYRYILSGLPAPEHTLNYFQQMLFLDKRIFGCKNYWEFRNRYFKRAWYDWKATKPGRKLINGRLAEHCYFLSRKDVQLGGEKFYEKRMVKKTPKFERIEFTLFDEYILEVDGKELKSTAYAGVNYFWAHQLCGGFAGDEWIYKSKLKALKNILELEVPDEPVVIWSVYINEINLLERFFTERKEKFGIIYGDIKQKNRRKVEREFQRGKLQYIVANPKCYKYGVNLSMTDIEIYYSSPMSLEVRSQSEDRPVNTATQDSTLIYDILVEDSIDMDIYESLMCKESRQEMEKRFIKRRQRMRQKGR